MTPQTAVPPGEFFQGLLLCHSQDLGLQRIQGQSNGAKFVKETVVCTPGIGVGFPRDRE